MVTLGTNNQQKDRKAKGNKSQENKAKQTRATKTNWKLAQYSSRDNRDIKT